MRALLSVALAASALAGCLSPVPPTTPFAPAESTAPRGSVEATVGPIPTEAEQNASTGALQGRVVDTLNQSIGGAHISLLLTPHFTRADRLGRFGIPEIAPGTYTMRVDADAYETVEEPVIISAGNATRVIAHLVLREDATAAFRPHVHDLWEGRERKTIVNESFPWPYAIASGNPDRQTCAGAAANPPPSAAPPPACSYIPIPVNTLVPPGTREIEARISWKPHASLPQVRLDYVTTNGSAGWQTFLLPNGVTKNATLERADTDNGHAAYTAWTMILYVQYRIAGDVWWNQGDTIRQNVGDFHVQVEALKGEIWPEDAHRHFWAAGPRLLLVDNLTQTLKEEANTADPDPRYKRDPQNRGWSSSGNPYFFGFTTKSSPGDVLVPPGTTRLEVTLTYAPVTASLDTAAAALSRKTLAFRTGDVNRFKATFDDLWVPTPTTKEAGRTVYQLHLEPEQTDHHYQKASTWLFLLANDGKELDPDFHNECGTPCGGTAYQLTVVAVNENYAADFAAGRI